jgi:hypothetical protein
LLCVALKTDTHAGFEPGSSVPEDIHGYWPKYGCRGIWISCMAYLDST